VIACLHALAGDRLGFPRVFSARAPLRWLVVAALARLVGAERWEAVALGHCMGVAVRRLRAYPARPSR
jgi:hypothetical protein